MYLYTRSTSSTPSLFARYSCTYYGYDEYCFYDESGWYRGGRWAFLAIVLLLLTAIGVITYLAVMRKRRGQQPLRGTAWIVNSNAFNRGRNQQAQPPYPGQAPNGYQPNMQQTGGDGPIVGAGAAGAGAAGYYDNNGNFVQHSGYNNVHPDQQAGDVVNKEANNAEYYAATAQPPQGPPPGENPYGKTPYSTTVTEDSPGDAVSLARPEPTHSR